MPTSGPARSSPESAPAAECRPRPQAGGRTSLGRRALLATIPATMTIAGCLAEPTDDDADDAPDPEPPFEVRTIDAPGSEAGTVVLPARTTVTVCNFTRPWCSTSEAYHGTIAEAIERVTDDRVQFLSLVGYGRDTASEEDTYPEWWAEHDGAWPLGIDADQAVFNHYGVGSTPGLVVLGEDGTILQDGTAVAGQIERAANDGLTALDG